jgi:deoxyadenosine/deoxycytidine kinase
MMVITVGAMIGAGKSSLAKIIGEHFGTDVFYESVEDNPILPLFYTASDKEIQEKRYPFLLQLYFLDTRFRSIKQALVNDNNVLDRSIYEDWYFCKVNRDLGRISDLEFEMYERLLNNMMEELNELPKKAPDLMIYLTGSFETIVERINKRGRGYELAPELLEYYRTLWEGYDDWVFNNYNASEVLVLNIDKYDYVNNEQHRKEVIEMIENKLKEVRGGIL